jgi:hypothetical protein
MMDIVIIILMGIALSSAMRKHGTWKGCNSIGDYIGWGMALFFLLVLVRLPIYCLAYGWHIPFPATEGMQLGTGAFAIAFWWAMLYFRVGSLVVRGMKGPQ